MFGMAVMVLRRTANDEAGEDGKKPTMGYFVSHTKLIILKI